MGFRLPPQNWRVWGKAYTTDVYLYNMQTYREILRNPTVNYLFKPLYSNMFV